MKEPPVLKQKSLQKTKTNHQENPNWFLEETTSFLSISAPELGLASSPLSERCATEAGLLRHSWRRRQRRPGCAGQLQRPRGRAAPGGQSPSVSQQSGTIGSSGPSGKAGFPVCGWQSRRGTARWHRRAQRNRPKKPPAPILSMENKLI